MQQFAGASNHAQLKAFDVDLEEVDVVKSMFVRMSVERRDRNFDDLVCDESLTIPCDVSARQRIQSAHFLVHAKLRGSGPLARAQMGRPSQCLSCLQRGCCGAMRGWRVLAQRREPAPVEPTR